MNIDLFYTILLLTALILSAANIYLFILRKRLKERELDASMISQKIMLLQREIVILEKKNDLMENQMANLTASMVSYEKVLTTLLTSQGGPFGGGFDPGDGNIH